MHTHSHTNTYPHTYKCVLYSVLIEHRPFLVAQKFPPGNNLEKKKKSQEILLAVFFSTLVTSLCRVNENDETPAAMY
jgi:hypothetical protein